MQVVRQVYMHMLTAKSRKDNVQVVQASTMTDSKAQAAPAPAPVEVAAAAPAAPAVILKAAGTATAPAAVMTEVLSAEAATASMPAKAQQVFLHQDMDTYQLHCWWKQDSW